MIFFLQNHDFLNEITLKFSSVKKKKKRKKYCFFENFEIRAAQNCENLVDLEKCCKMTIYLQRSARSQPRTSLGKSDVS